MRSLTIRCPSPIPMIHASTLFQNLEELSLTITSFTPVPAAVLRHWSALRRLKTISLVIPTFQWTIEWPTWELCFENLESLSLSCPFTDAFMFLSIASFPMLSSFTFNLILPQFPDLQVYPWAGILQTLRSNTSPCFQELVIGLWDDRTPETRLRNTRFTASHPTVPFSDLEATLLDFNLSRFCTYFPLLQPLTLEDVVNMRDAWPEIESLVIGMPEIYEAKLDLNVLQVLSDERCESLETLELTVNAALVPRPKKTRSTHRLGCLKLNLENWNDTFENRCSLASYIDSLFPYIHFVSSNGEELEGVKGIIDALQMGRRRERRHNDIAEAEDSDEDHELSDLD
ncbi:hypothetical protein CVT24_009555 [Panaeolus cyanescens]|uniref:F-box domain-containing protein n=1 Tax=Panaeolus cyanescens TaxID=181874 RepID=A0A409YAE7_9AGAR|nr:hypothetical protein CVT24_009555 [Panaeolus cyanescens]